MWFRARQPWKMAVSQGRDISSVLEGDLKGLKELIAHLMRNRKA